MFDESSDIINELIGFLDKKHSCFRLLYLIYGTFDIGLLYWGLIFVVFRYCIGWILNKAFEWMIIRVEALFRVYLYLKKIRCSRNCFHPADFKLKSVSDANLKRLYLEASYLCSQKGSFAVVEASDRLLRKLAQYKLDKSNAHRALCSLIFESAFQSTDFLRCKAFNGNTTWTKPARVSTNIFIERYLAFAVARERFYKVRPMDMDVLNGNFLGLEIGLNFDSLVNRYMGYHEASGSFDDHAEGGPIIRLDQTEGFEAGGHGANIRVNSSIPITSLASDTSSENFDVNLFFTENELEICLATE